MARRSNYYRNNQRVFTEYEVWKRELEGKKDPFYTEPWFRQTLVVIGCTLLFALAAWSKT